MGKKKGRIALSFPKLESVIVKAEYHIERLYVEEGAIVFMLCKSPKFQKSFVVHIPSKFNLPQPKKCDLECVEITTTPAAESILSKRQISYLEDITSEGVSSIICISNSSLTSCSAKGLEHYVVPSEIDDEEDFSGDDESDEVDALEKNTKKLEKAINKLKSGGKIEKKSSSKQKHSNETKSDGKKPSNEKKSDEKKPDEKKPDEKKKSDVSKNVHNEEESEKETDEESEKVVEEETEEESEKEVETEEEEVESEKEVEGKVELIFDEDDDDDDEVDDDIVDEDIESENDDDSSVESTGETGDNSFPQDMLERDIVIGVIYILIDVSPFLKTISNFEEGLVSQYTQIDVNEFELRKARLSRIKNCFDSVYEKVGETIEKKREEEKKIKAKIVRSTILLLQIQALKDRIKDNPSKYSDISSEIQETYDQTTKTISNMNLDVMELRDEVDEMLTNFSAVIKDLDGITK